MENQVTPSIYTVIQAGKIREMKRLESIEVEQSQEITDTLSRLRGKISHRMPQFEEEKGEFPMVKGTFSGSGGAIKRDLTPNDWLENERNYEENVGYGEGINAVLPADASRVALNVGKEFAERIIKPGDLMNIAWLSRGLELSRAVARIHVPGGVGTGFLIGPGLLLTNHHVIPDSATAQAPATVVEFDYQQNYPGTAIASKKYQTAATGFRTNAELDYSLVKVEGQPELEFGYIDIANYSLPDVDSCVSIVQHPSGGFKQLALQNNTVHNIRGNFVQYSTDTESGLSGSAVFDREWRLIALHHKGGDLPKPSGGAYFINQGVLISSIVRDAGESLHLVDALEELVFGPLLPMLARVISLSESAKPLVWVLNGDPRFNAALNRGIAHGYGASGVPVNSGELAPLIAAALGVAAGASAQTLSRKMEINFLHEENGRAFGKINALVDDVVRVAKDTRQVYQGIVAKMDELKEYTKLLLSKSDLMEEAAKTKSFPITIAAFLAGVTTGAASARFY